MLTREQEQFWDDNGVLILPGFYSHEAIDKLLALQQQTWKTLPSNVVVDDLLTGRRCYMSSLSNEETKHRFKINDLFLNYDEVRSISLDRSLVEILSVFLSDIPVLCNTLSFDYGSGQDLHIDSLYMTPLTDNHLAATWIALEDCQPEAGPLRYVLGSHKIPIYKFSTGSAHVVEEEFPLWRQHVESHVSSMGLKEQTFMPKKGDLLIWHGQLLHGGSPILNPNRTRKSIVSHYYGGADCIRLGYKLAPFGGGYWWDRPPQPVTEAEGSNAASVSEKRKPGSSSTPSEKALLYSVDIVNGRALPKDVPIFVEAKDRELTIGGWAVDHQAETGAGGVFISIDGKKEVPAVYGQERLDVATVHNNPRYLASGFAVSIPTSLMEKGRHTLTLKVLKADRSGYYEPEQRIDVYVH
jgi:hypothetical protein